MTIIRTAHIDRIAGFEQSPGLSEESRKNITKIEEIAEHFNLSVSRQNGIKQRFYFFSMRWKADTQYLSSINEMVLHPAYQQIVGMGPAVISSLLLELKKDPDYWFEALKAITGIDPVAENDMGNLSKMVESWLDWGRVNGYIK